MKVLHIVPSYLPAYGYGGPIKSVHSLNKWLAKKGADVTVYTTNIDGQKRLNVPTCREADLDGVRVHYFPITFAPWQYSSAMREALKRNAGGFDVIHITSVFLAASTLGACYAKKFKKPYVISPRGSLMKEPLGRKSRFLKRIYISLVERKNLAGASAIHFTAEVEKKEYIDAGLPLSNSFVIPNSFDAEEIVDELSEQDFRNDFNILSNKKIVLSLGRLNWKKGFDTLIPAFKRVLEKEPDAILVIVGGDDENYKKEIQKLIKKHGLKEGRDVIFKGLQTGAQKAAFIENSLVSVYPSYSENFGMAAMEGAHGTAVVVSKGVGISPYISKYNAGLVVEKDEKEFAEAILKILKDPTLKERFKERGKEMIRKEFSPDKVAEATLAEYNEILKK